MKDIKDGRSIFREVLEEYRFRALELKDKNWKVNKIAEAFGLHRGTVSNWFTTYRREGKKGLKQKKS
ncbi:MAG: helix-turn-helix domain-containing protein [Nanoarchaeota archaeon]|nr:helix-turn-helix domain-containing protein [Nanoarchaeota archaeon]